MPQEIDEQKRTEIEAAAFRRMVKHLRDHPEVQNIDLMITADFCRNCLSGWYQDAAGEQGITLSKGEAREITYGMPYEAWKDQHQTPATPEQEAAMSERKKNK